MATGSQSMSLSTCAFFVLACVTAVFGQTSKLVKEGYSTLEDYDKLPHVNVCDVEVRVEQTMPGVLVHFQATCSSSDPEDMAHIFLDGMHKASVRSSGETVNIGLLGVGVFNTTVLMVDETDATVLGQMAVVFPLWEPMEKNLNMPLQRILDLQQHRSLFKSKWLGIPTMKAPTDFWTYQELLFERKPEFIVELGTAMGGSALMFANLLDLIGGPGQVLTVGLFPAEGLDPRVKNHPRIKFFVGEGASDEIFRQISELVVPSRGVLVVEDSSHTYQHTLAVLRRYSNLVSRPNDYFVVEDTSCNNGIKGGPKPGPMEAVEQFMQETNRFEIDRSRESFVITWFPRGWLRCTRS